MRRQAQPLGDLLVGHPFHHADHNVFFPRTQQVAPGFRFFVPVGETGQFEPDLFGRIVQGDRLVVDPQRQGVGQRALQGHAFHRLAPRFVPDALQRKKPRQRRIHDQDVGLLPAKRLDQLFGIGDLHDAHIQSGEPFQHRKKTAADNLRRLGYGYFQRNAHHCEPFLRSSSTTAGTNRWSSIRLCEARSRSHEKISNNALLSSLLPLPG